jgi:hypothetical protein
MNLFKKLFIDQTLHYRAKISIYSWIFRKMKIIIEKKFLSLLELKNYLILSVIETSSIIDEILKQRKMVYYIH